ncbi:MAG: hypothetical protein QM647_11790 [Asticcacaulis sp.]|uniref:hypothetical protein n=1 Tax=Asticcacaulis sp. TaxID=1872648 RepID=UPI0039E3EF9A
MKLKSILPSQPLIMGLAVFAALLWAPQMFNDGDTFWHLAAGNWIIDHHAVPHTDPFSFSFAGKPWLMHEWLSEVFMAIVFRLAGWSSLAVLTAGAAGLTTWIVARVAARWLGGMALWLTVMLGLSLIGPHFLMRPHILILPLLAAWCGELVEARADNRGPGWWLIPVMVLWDNMHGSFLFGLCLLAPFALEAWLAAPVDGRRTAMIQWGGFGLMALVAALITPHGFEGLLFPVKLLIMPGIAGVTEWAAADFSKLSPLEIGILGAVFVIVRQRAEVPLLRLVILLALVHLTFKHSRQEMVLGVLGVLLLAEPLGRTFSGSINGTPGQVKSSHMALVLTGIAVIALSGLRVALPIAEPRTANTPVAALAAVPADLRAQPVLNHYDTGGYLIWKGVRPFIDGRTDMYGADFFASYNRAVSPDQATLEKTLADYRIRWTLLRADTGAATTMDHMPGWKRLYADRQFVVHVRE